MADPFKDVPRFDPSQLVTSPVGAPAEAEETTWITPEELSELSPEQAQEKAKGLVEREKGEAFNPSAAPSELTGQAETLTVVVGEKAAAFFRMVNSAGMLADKVRGELRKTLDQYFGLPAAKVPEKGMKGYRHLAQALFVSIINDVDHSDSPEVEDVVDDLASSFKATGVSVKEAVDRLNKGIYSHINLIEQVGKLSSHLATIDISKRQGVHVALTSTEIEDITAALVQLNTQLDALKTRVPTEELQHLQNSFTVVMRPVATAIGKGEEMGRKIRLKLEKQGVNVEASLSVSALTQVLEKPKVAVDNETKTMIREFVGVNQEIATGLSQMAPVIDKVAGILERTNQASADFVDASLDLIGKLSTKPQGEGKPA